MELLVIVDSKNNLYFLNNFLYNLSSITLFFNDFKYSLMSKVSVLIKIWIGKSIEFKNFWNCNIC